MQAQYMHTIKFLFVLSIGLQLICLPVWTLMPPTQGNDKNGLTESNEENGFYVRSPRGKQSGEDLENILNIGMVSDTKKHAVKFRIGQQAIQINAENPCEAQQLFYGFMAAILERRDIKLYDLDTFTISNEVKAMNQAVSSFFESLPKNDDFIASYIGQNGGEVMIQVLEGHLNWLNKNKDDVQNALRTLFPWLDDKNTCDFNGPLLQNENMTFFDYLLFHSTKKENFNLKNDIKKTFRENCNQGDKHKFWDLNPSCISKNIINYNLKNNPL
ncbi:hypothetical protein HMI56_007117 [Coelomomyces lativittatus]|nr:hypothetical protein HMI56_007117 [Coelomomyces lativittatus]